MVSKSATALIGAGVFSLSLAAFVVTVAEPTLVKAPATLNKTTHFTGTAQSIDQATGKLVDGTLNITQVTGTHTKVVNGKSVRDKTGDVVAFDSFATNTFLANGASKASVLSQSQSTYTVNIKSSVMQPGNHGKASVYAAGTNAIKLPFNVTKTGSYHWWDDSTNTSVKLAYNGERSINGLKTYDFTYSVPATDVGKLAPFGIVPGAWVGSSAASIPADQWVTTTQHLFIEPVTGAPVGVNIEEHVWAQTAAGQKVDLLKANGIHIIAKDTAALVKTAKSGASQVTLLHRAPYALGALGLLLLGGGIGLTLRSRRRTDATPEVPTSRPDVSGVLPAPRVEPAVDPAKVRG